MKLSALKVGDKAYILSVDTSFAFAQRLIEMGFSADSEVEVVFAGISKHLRAYGVKNTIISLRNETADKINVILKSEGVYE